MSANLYKPVVESGSCRCCGNIKKCRLLNMEYEWLGRKEVYSDMFVDCYGLFLSHLDVEADCLICDTCVTRLREACSFREQVLQFEQKLLQAKTLLHDDDKIKEVTEIKQEEGDSDHHCADDGLMDKNEDDAGIEIKIEPPPEKTKKAKLVTKRKLVKKVSEEHLKAKKELLHRIKKKRSKLKSLKDDIDDAADDLFLKPPAPKTVYKDINALHNAVTIVQNSYVCPFLNTFSVFNCIYCKEIFTEPDKLRQHTLNHDPSEYEEALIDKKIPKIDITRIDCRLCPVVIDNIPDFKKHIVEHGKVIYTVTDNEFLQFRLKMGKISCVECGVSFGYFQGLKRHMAEHFGTHKCDLCGLNYFDRRGLFMHMKIHEVKSDFPCNQCGKIYKSQDGRNYHVSRKHNKPKFPCYKCDEVLYSHLKRYRHMIEVHGETRSFPCEKCDRVYDSLKGLREHNRRIHLKVLRHECTVCDKKFYQPSALKDHMASHTGERNYRCEYCGKTYLRLSALRMHLQSHDSDKKRFKCSLCDVTYAQANNLRTHMKTKHQGFDVKDNVER